MFTSTRRELINQRWISVSVDFVMNDSEKKVASRQLVVSEIALSFKHDYGCRNV